MTKKEIIIKIKELEEKVKDLYNYYVHIPEYKSLMNKINQLKDEYLKTVRPLRNQYDAEIQQLKIELKKSKKEPLIILKELEDWFWEWQRGVDFGYGKPYIRWKSSNEKYVIITTPGGTSGQRTALGTYGYYYALTSHYLVKVIEGAALIERTIHSKMAECEGRLTKEKKNEWMLLISEDVQQMQL